MAGLEGQQFVIIRVPNVVEEADFFARVFDAGATAAGDARHVNTGSLIVRIERSEADKERTRNVSFEVSVDNVNKFAEEVWNRGIKYASRPQNHADGMRRVAFVSPGEIKVSGVGPLKLDSTGAFSSFRPERK